MAVGIHISRWERVFRKMKEKITILLFLILIAGCKDSMNDPVGLDEVPKNIPQPVYIEGILADSFSNFHSDIHTGPSQKLWVGKTDFIESRILVRFEVSDSALLADADSATVTLNLNGTWAKGLRCCVYPLTRSWDEATVTWEYSSADSQWNIPGGDYEESAVIDTLLINDQESKFRLNYDEFFLLDTSLSVNKGMLIVYDIGDTILSFYSKESASNQLQLTLYYGDSTEDYFPQSDAFITNSTYTQGNNEVVLSQGYARRALFYFTLDTIPNDVTVNSALLEFAFNPSKSFFDTISLYIHKVTGDWEEDQTTYSTLPLAGFTVVEGDTLSSEVNITSLVQTWLNNKDNKGILIRAENEASLCSRLVLDILNRPMLEIYYTPAPE